MHVYTFVCWNPCVTQTPPTIGMNRRGWTTSEAEILTKCFQVNMYTKKGAYELHQLATSLNISERTVENLFTSMHRKERGVRTLPEGE